MNKVEISLEEFYSHYETPLKLSGLDNCAPHVKLWGEYEAPLIGPFNPICPPMISLIGPQEADYIDTWHRQRSHEFTQWLKECKGWFIVCTHADPSSNWLDCFKRTSKVVFQSGCSKKVVYTELESSLAFHIYPQKTVSGVLLEIFQKGVLLIGQSQIGKSTLALALLKRGHRLVSDDIVCLTAHPLQGLIGSAPKENTGLLEVRGLGIIDVTQSFVPGTVLSRYSVDIVVHLLSGATQCGVLSPKTERFPILGIELPKVELGVSSHLDLAWCLEKILEGHLGIKHFPYQDPNLKPSQRETTDALINH